MNYCEHKICNVINICKTTHMYAVSFSHQNYQELQNIPRLVKKKIQFLVDTKLN